MHACSNLLESPRRYKVDLRLLRLIASSSSRSTNARLARYIADQAFYRIKQASKTSLGRRQAIHIPPDLCLLPSFPCSPFCMSPAVLLSDTYKRVVCVCWFVCPLFIGHTTFVHFAALPPSGREQPSRRGPGGPARAGKRMHSESTRARGRPRRLGCSRSTRRQRRKVDKCRVADKKQTNQQTNKPTNTHCSFIGIDLLQL